MEAVILRQSVQLQMNVVTKPGLSGRGYEASTRVKKPRKGEGWCSGKWSSQGETYECQLDSTTQASRCCFIFVGPARELELACFLSEIFKSWNDAEEVRA